MRVLTLSSMYYKPGGTYAGLAIHRQTVESARSGVDVQVICPVPRFTRNLSPLGSRRPGDDTLRVDGVDIRYLPFPNVPVGILPALQGRLLFRWLRKAVGESLSPSRFDLIHAHQIFPTGDVAVRIGRERGLPVIVSAVGSDVHTHPQRNRGIRRRACQTVREADQVVAVSEGLARKVEELAEPSRPVRVIYRGVDTGSFAPPADRQALRERRGLPLHGVGICSVGRLVRAKGIRELLDAFEGLSARFPGSWLALVGDGPLRGEVEERNRSGPLEGRIHILGARPHAEVAEWMGAADVFALASHAEGLPNVVLEAMACALPVVATRVGGVAEAVDEGRTGHLVEKGDTRALQEALLALMESVHLREGMGRAGRERVQSVFSWHRNGRAWVELYREVLARVGEPSLGGPVER